MNAASFSLRTLLATLACLISLPLTGSSIGTPRAIKSNPDITRLMDLGNLEVGSGNYRKGLEIYSKVYQAAAREQDIKASLASLNNIAALHGALYEYPQAGEAYLKARKLAELHGMWDSQTFLNFNLALFYLQLGDLGAAISAAEKGRQAYMHTVGDLESDRQPPTRDPATGKAIRGDPRTARDKFLTCLALLQARLGNSDRAVAYFQRALFYADLNADNHAMAQDWDGLGEEMILKGDYPSADQALTESFRLRKLFHDRDLRVSLIRLSWLRLEQGDLRSATVLMNTANGLPASDGMAPWLVLYLKARLAEKSGDPRDALGYYRDALRAAREFQQQAAPHGVPGDYAQQRLNSLYQDLVRTSLSVDRLGMDAFQATEEDRAAALRQTLTASRSFLEKAPPEYWETLAKLRQAQSQQLVKPDEESRKRVQSLRALLSEIEVRIGVPSDGTINTKSTEKNTALTTLSRIQQGIRPDEALLSFHVGRETSALWAVSRDRFELCRIRADGDLSAKVTQFRQAVEHQSGQRDDLGQELYRRLFSDLSAEMRQKKVWMVSAESVFFSVPMSALVVERKDGKPVYLVQQHTLLFTPSAADLSSDPKPAPAGPFLGIGDGIYNAADPRWRMRAKTASGLLAGETKPKFQLARLAGSGQELAACASNWPQGSPALLTGAQASRTAFVSALERKPSVIHFASHFLSPAGAPDEGVIDLGLTPAGDADVLNEKEIASLRAPDSTVVMSGCSSGDSSSIPTAGVLGLTRAWLIAGARAVVGSRWPTPDDTGDLFRSFYTRLRERIADPARMRAAAAALRDAQLEMLMSNTWRSDPRYWSAFYILGKE